MGGHIKRNVKKVDVVGFNNQINKEIFDAFKDRVKAQGYSMNIILETFMRQYANRRFRIRKRDIERWMEKTGDTDTLNTTFNKEIYSNFKFACQNNGYYVKYVIMAFMERYVDEELVLEFVSNKKINRS